MKKGLKIFIIVIAALAVIITAGTVIVSNMTQRLEDFLATVVIRPVNLETISDGTYRGQTDAGIIQVRLNVDIRNHRITDIDLIKHRNGQGEAAEKLVPRIIEKQQVNLDTISGATYSSLAIQNAVIDALTE